MLANQRLVVLYLRSRGVPFTVLGLMALVVLTGWETRWLNVVQGRVGVFDAMLAAILLGGGFGTPVPSSTPPLRCHGGAGGPGTSWPGWRCAPCR